MHQSYADNEDEVGNHRTKSTQQMSNICSLGLMRDLPTLKRNEFYREPEVTVPEEKLTVGSTLLGHIRSAYISTSSR